MSDALASLFTTGRAIDFALAVMLAEGLWLALGRRRPAFDVLLMLLPGALLMLALRAALTGAGWRIVALWLVLSLPVHLADVWRRGR